MKCVEELSPETLFDLDEIEALPAFDVSDFPAIAFTFTEAGTSSATACTYSVTVANENPYDGVFCFAQSPFGLWAWDGDWIQMGIGGLLGFYGKDVASSWMEVEGGAYATIDGLIPFADPFESAYADECGNVDDIYKTSQMLGGVSRDLLLSAGGIGYASRLGTGAKAVQVSRWGRPGLKSGDWVMRGPANRWNYLMSGKYQPSWMPGGNMPASFSSGQAFTVPGSSLQVPSGFFGPLKGAIGQSVFVP